MTAISDPEAQADITRPGRAQFGQDAFEKFMGVGEGEYEYAWLALFSTAAVHPPAVEFWPQMAEAAMLLITHAHQPFSQCARCDPRATETARRRDSGLWK